MNKYLVGILALLLQVEAAAASCLPGNVMAKWNLVGSLFKDQGVASFAFYCPELRLISSGGTAQFLAAANCKAMSAGRGATGAFTISTKGTNVITVNPKTCVISGRFILTHEGKDFAVKILTGQMDVPAGNGKPTQGQFVALAASDLGVVTATIIRYAD
jgi:hypothetical protein